MLVAVISVKNTQLEQPMYHFHLQEILQLKIRKIAFLIHQSFDILDLI